MTFSKDDVQPYIDEYFWGFLDGWAVALTVYLLSPAEHKFRNTVAVGVVHAVLHPSASKYHCNDHVTTTTTTTNNNNVS